MCRTRIVLMLAMTAAVLAVDDRPAHGQTPPPAVEIAAGGLMFPGAAEPFVGGAARIYLSPRISVGPEISHVIADNHSHLILTGNVTFDLFRPTSIRRPVMPYIVAGAGLYQTREQFPGERLTTSEGSFTAGGGIRAWISERMYVGAEARVGWEPHLRLNGLLGIRFKG